VVRFLPPLTASDELVNEGLDILRETLLELRS
jgi:4-aminobutyrate aminotransferase-like enzyme